MYTSIHEKSQTYTNTRAHTRTHTYTHTQHKQGYKQWARNDTHANIQTLTLFVIKETGPHNTRDPCLLYEY